MEQEKREAPMGGVYTYFRTKASGFSEEAALNYFGKKITYQTLFREIDRVTRALTAFGVRKGDVVVSALPSIPEAIFLFYAVNRIGAIYCALDCRSKERDIQETFYAVRPRLCFAPDFQINEFRKMWQTPVVYVHCANYMGFSAQWMMFFSDIFKWRFPTKRKYNILSYQAFLKYEKRDVARIPEDVTAEEDVCCYFYTSGTTYGRKCVVLTNRNINTAAQIQAKLFGSSSVGERILGTMPPFTCYGVTLGIHLPLSLGIEIRLVPLFLEKNMMKLLKRERPQYIISVPSHWDTFVSKKTKVENLDFFKVAVIGGDKVTPQFWKALSQKMEECGAVAEIRTGYGLTETTASATNPTKDDPIESVGRALPGIDIGIFREGTEQRLPTGETGEICISGPTVCAGYLGDEEQTNKLLRKHRDGKIWLHSGDSGYMDAEGNVFFQERLKRMFVRFDGTKISPYSIETTIGQCEVVDKCLVVSIPDKEYSHGCCAKALVVLRNDGIAEENKAVLRKYIQKNLPVHMQPEETEFVKTLPLTKVGKIDYFAK